MTSDEPRSNPSATGVEDGSAPPAKADLGPDLAGEQALPAFGGRAGPRRRPVLTALIALNVLVALATLVLIVMEEGFSAPAILFDGISPIHEWGEMHGPSVEGGEVWRLVTAAVLHYGLAHLLVNMAMLGLAGWKLEPILGSGRFLALYLLCAFGAGVATYFFAHGALTAGSSGANFGVFSALLVVCIRLRRGLWLPAVLVALGIAATVVVPGMAVAAHAGGLLLGAVLAAGYAYASGPRRETVQRWVPLWALVVLLALTAVGLVIG